MSSTPVSRVFFPPLGFDIQIPIYEDDQDVKQQIQSMVCTSHQILDVNEINYFDKLKKNMLKKSLNHEKYLTKDQHNTFGDYDSHKSAEIQEKSVDISNIYHCQSGILASFDANAHALYLIFHLTPEHDDDVRKACKILPQLTKSLSQLHPGCRLEATLGIGYSKTQEWLARANIPFPKSFIEFQEKQGPTGKYMPHTGGSLMLHIKSNRKDLCFELGRQFCQYIPDDSIAKLDECFGFSYMSSKISELSQDFIGFEDGNENPKGDEQKAKAALISNGEDVAIHVGGSFALTQKWKHNLLEWNRLSQEEQQNVIGRTKGEDSKKIRPKIPTSHTTRTDLKDNGVDIKVVRQSLPYGGMLEHGLFFLSYASNPNKHEKQLNSMIGVDNEIYDRLMDFSTPITGNYWFIPSTNVYETIF